MQKTKECNRCGLEADREVFFRKNRYRNLRKPSGQVYLTERGTCIGCESEARVLRTQTDRWLEKARMTRQHHAEKWSRIHPDDPLTAPQYGRRWGWDLHRMAHDAEHAYSNKCHYCELPYDGMGHGLSDISLDIVDRMSHPLYTTNTRWACLSCNREKATRMPDQWARYLMAWKAYHERKADLQRNPFMGLPLFNLSERVRRHKCLIGPTLSRHRSEA